VARTALLRSRTSSPNQFELGWLAEPPDTVDGACGRPHLDAATARPGAGGGRNRYRTEGGSARQPLVDAKAPGAVHRTPADPAHGTGDYFAARLVGRRLLGADLKDAVAAATADTARVVAATAAANRREIAIAASAAADRINAAMTRIG
jgi:pyridoxal/pyridoxine/pyridoxamine kinase